MRPALPPLSLLVLLGCGPPASDSTALGSGSPSGSTSGSPVGLTTGSPVTGTATTRVDPPVLTWDGPPAAVEVGPETHHATVTIAPDLRAWVAYQADAMVRVRTLPSTLVHDSTPIAFDHPQLAAAGDRVVGLSTLSAGGLNASVWDSDGVALGPPIWLDATVGGFPDLGLTSTEGVAAWTEGDHIGCAFLGVHLATSTSIPCPTSLDPAKLVSTLALDYNDHGGWLAWSEATLGTPASVVVAQMQAVGASNAQVMQTAVAAGNDARPDVVATAWGGLLVWRGADGPVNPSQAWFAAFTEPSDTLTPVVLGSAGDRPDLAAAGVLAVVVWEQADGLWLQWADPHQGGLLGEPLEVATSDSPQRPSVALREDGSGWVGVVSWEARPSGPEGPREVRTRTLRAAW